MPRAYIGIGSNIDRDSHIPASLNALRLRFGELVVSSIYEADAVGFAGDSFYNLVVGFDAAVEPTEIVTLLKQIEADNGRTRNAAKDFGHTLDLDLLLYGNLISNAGGLQLPCQDIERYAFVLEPLAEIAPDAQHPILGQSYQELWEKFDKTTVKQKRINVSPPRVSIIGGGVAAMSCALWLKQLGFLPEIIERNATLGGQLLNIDRINRWVLGFQNKTSKELATLYSQHIDAENIAIRYNSEVTAIESTATDFKLFLQDENNQQSVSQARFIVIATGVRPETLSKINGFNTLFSAGLINCFPIDHLKQLDALQGKTVAVIGGGDNAHFTVADLAPVAARTFLLIRSQPKAQKKIRHDVQEFIKQGRVVEYSNVEISAFTQTQDGIELSLATSPVTKIKVDSVFVRIGFVANSEFLAMAEKQGNGYIVTDAQRRTSIACVYAIGDVASPQSQSVVNAIADGAIAAKTISQDSN